MFDPYHKWLGIPKDQRPPTHYQLLGLSPAEQDPEVIEEAAIRQTTHIRAYQIGQHSAECTQLQKEIAKARLTLVNPAKRTAYDEQLAQAGKGHAAPATDDTGDAGIKAGAPQHGGAAPYDAEVLDEPRQDTDPALREQKHPANVRQAGLPIGLLIGMGAGAVLLLLVVFGVGVGFWFVRSGPAARDGNPIVENKGKDGKKPIRDGEEIRKDDLLKKDDAANKDDAAKKDDGKLNKPNVDPDPAKKPVPTVVLKGRVAPELVIELPKDTFSPFLTNDGLRVAYTKLQNWQNSVFLYREAPDFAKEHQVTLPGEAGGMIHPTASSPDGKKMVLIPQREPVNGTCKVLLWDWDKRAVTGTFVTFGPPQRVVLSPDMKHLGVFAMRFVKEGVPPEYWVHLHQVGGKQNQVMQCQVDSPVICMGFTPDSDTFLFAPAKGQHCRTLTIKKGEFGEMPFVRHTLLHAFSTDFSHHAVRESTFQVQVRNFDASRVPRTILSPDAKTWLNGVAFSQDNRYLLVGTQTVEKSETALGQLAMFDLTNGEVVSASEPALGIPFIVQLGANGIALEHHHQRMTRLYRFPIGLGDTFVKVEPPGIQPKNVVAPGAGNIVNRNSGKVIGVQNAETRDGALLVQWGLIKDAPNQRWKLVAADTGWFHIVNVGSDTCLSVDRDASDDGARLVIWKKKDGERAQQWKLVTVDKNDAGWFKIVNRASGKVIGVQGGSMQNVAAVVLAEDGMAAHLLWKVDNPDVVAKLDPPKTKGDPPASKDDPPVKLVRVAVPDADKAAESEKTIREQFKKEYAKKAASDTLALAEKLHKLAGETTDDSVACYVLLREARDLAVKAGRAELAMKVVTDLCAKYELDELGQRVDTLLSFSKLNMTADGYKQFVEIALAHAAGAMLDDHFDESLKVMGAADAAAHRSSNTALLTQVQKQDKQIKEVARDHADMKAAQAKLAEDMKDAQANLTVGLYLAFRKGNWEQGLPLLAQGNNAELQDLAKKDLGVEDDDKARVEVGDGWWTGAEKKPAFHKTAMQWRAAYWYRQAIPSLKGFAEAKVSERIKQVDAQPAPFRVVSSAGEVDRFKGHTGAVNFVNLSTDGKRLFSCGADGTLRSWELATGKSRVLLGPPVYKVPLISFAVSPDERQAVLLRPGNKMVEVDLQTLKPAYGGLERDAVPGLYWSSNITVNYYSKTNWNTWNPTQTINSGAGPLVFTNPPLTGNVRAVAFTTQHDMGAALMNGETVITFRLQDNGARSLYANISFDATAAAFAKDAGLVVLGGKEGNLRAYSMTVKVNDSVKELSTFKGHSGSIRSIACTPDGKTMISGGDDKTLRIWDVASGKQLQRSVHPGVVASLVVTPDGRYVISACADSIIRVWSLPK